MRLVGFFDQFLVERKDQMTVNITTELLNSTSLLLNFPIESCQVQRIEFIAAPLSETCTLLADNPEVSGLLLHGLTAQVDHAQAALSHLLH